MPENSSGTNSGFLYFIVGALVIVVGGLAYLYFGLHLIGPKGATTTTTVVQPNSTGGTTTNSTTTTSP